MLRMNRTNVHILQQTCAQVEQDKCTLYIPVHKAVYRYRHVPRLNRTGIQVSIILRKQINIVEDKTLNPIFIQEHDGNVTKLFCKYFDVSQIYFSKWIVFQVKNSQTLLILRTSHEQAESPIYIAERSNAQCILSEKKAKHLLRRGGGGAGGVKELFNMRDGM